MSKKTKRRHCPGLSREITSQECGADRISRIACPAECPFNTFGPDNYDDFGELESRVLHKTRERLFSSMGRERLHRFSELMLAGGADADRGHYYHLQELNVQRDSEGRNFLDHWAAEGWPGLNNDERIVAEGHRQVRPVLLELQCVLDEITFQAVDLLQPGSAPLVVVDRALTQRLRRFQTLLTWIYPAPHFQRISGSGRIVQGLGPCPPLETVLEIARHLGGPSSNGGLPDWLWTEYLRFLEAHEAVLAARWEDMMKLLDAKSAIADYRVPGSYAELSDVLVAEADIEECDPGRDDWKEGFERCYDVLDYQPVEPVATPGIPVAVGQLRLGKEKLRLEATSAARFERLKQRVEKLAGRRVEFISERVEDMAGQMLTKQSRPWNPALVPPRLREQPQRLTLQSQRLPMAPGESPEDANLLAFRRAMEALPDQSLPALGDHTPRAAAADPALRPALLELMKTHVQKVDDMRQREGMDVDMNDILEELGLHEIIFPPVPLPDTPEAARELAGEMDDELDDEDGPPPDFSLEDFLVQATPEEQAAWLRPPPLRPLLTEKEVNRLMLAQQKQFPQPGQVLDWLEDEWPALYDVADSSAGPNQSEEVFAIAAMQIARAAWALFPEGPPAEMVHPDRLAFYLALEAKQVLGAAKSDDWHSLDHAMSDSSQPKLTGALCHQITALCEGRKPILTCEEALVMIPLIKAVVRELCALAPH